MAQAEIHGPLVTSEWLASHLGDPKVRVIVLYFVLTRILACLNVRVYDGSWTEWGDLTDVPIER